jgi:hypothetical protein
LRRAAPSPGSTPAWCSRALTGYETGTQ